MVHRILLEAEQPCTDETRVLAGLLDALHNETPPSVPAMSPTNKLHAAYEPISEAELLADGLIEPVSPPNTSSLSHAFITSLLLHEALVMG